MKRILALLTLFLLVLASCGGAHGETYTCTFSISCAELVGCDTLDLDKRELIPEKGNIYAPAEVSFTEGESVFDILMRVCRENKIHFEYSEVPMYATAYIEGIANLYEFDAGALSGWVYTVNGESPNYGASKYYPEDGDVIEWNFTVEGRGANGG